MLRITRWVIIQMLVLCFSLPCFANTEQDFLKARTEYLCSWMAVSSYHDKLGNLARDELAQRGWVIEPQTEKKNGASAKFNIATKTDADNGHKTTLVSVAGTSDMADVKLDMRLHTVPYHQDGTDNIKVHTGFNTYANTLLDSPYGQGTVGEMLQAAADNRQNQAIIFTGHSLGGAVATLLGSHMADQQKKNVYVVTFGAPAVGNAAYNAAYGDAIHLDRVIIAGDPVPNMVQAVSGSYEQFDRETKWQENSNLNHFQHKMIVYTDSALRNYYDTKEAYEAELGQSLIQRTDAVRTVNLFVVAPEFDLDEELAADEKYMESASNDYLRDYWHGLVFSKDDTRSLAQVCEEARKNGCQYILMRRFGGEKIKDAHHMFRMNLQEEIYDTSGSLISAQQYTTNTDTMTPIEATLYLTGLGQKKRVLIQ
ncbi:MAG: lipase family protein [Megasphaera sp.]|nr:lipase family protein [Megasphaera sp.]